MSLIVKGCHQASMIVYTGGSQAGWGMVDTVGQGASTSRRVWQTCVELGAFELAEYAHAIAAAHRQAMSQ